MEFPEVQAFEASDSEQDAADELARLIEALGTTAPFVMTSAHGDTLVSSLKGVTLTVTPPPAPPSSGPPSWAHRFIARAPTSSWQLVEDVCSTSPSLPRPGPV